MYKKIASLKKTRLKIPAAIEAVEQNYMSMEMRVKKIETEVKTIKRNMATKNDLKNLEKTLIPLRDKASKWDLMQTLLRSKCFWIFVSAFFIAVALAGPRFVEIFGTMVR